MVFFAHSATDMTHSPTTQSDPTLVELDKDFAALLQTVHCRFADALQSLYHHSQSGGASLLSLTVLPSSPVDRNDETTCRLLFSALRPDAGYIECSDTLAKALIGKLIGNTDNPAQATLPLSGLERQLWVNAMQPLLECYAKMWDFAPFHARIAADDSAPIDGPHYIAKYEIQTAHGSGQLTVALRLPAWNEALAKGKQQMKRESSSPSANPGLLRAIGNCTVKAQALLGTTTISVRDLLSLQPGDIICLDRTPDDPVEVRIGARARLWGRVQMEQKQYVITLEQCGKMEGRHGSE